MKTLFCWKNALRAMLLVVGVLGLSLPFMSQQEDSGSSVQQVAMVQLPQGINAGETHTSWNAVFAASR
ncbi:hypothetical protein [Comamonas sp. Y33R10-2]|uniref:hypothetical protein n=1 Tax=Comamonas sp. Y33R10-2 TaxID=2853257 RepID=UPI002103CC2E|nr:hypothetical protein [Comamonas sp. Y33R10-2]